MLTREMEKSKCPRVFARTSSGNKLKQNLDVSIVETCSYVEFIFLKCLSFQVLSLVKGWRCS